MSSSPRALLFYPVLQAADVLAYRAGEVPVGEDQREHLELMREIARRFNARFGGGEELLVVPEHRIPQVGARIMDLQDPTSKMSTTGGSEEGTVYVLDEPQVIEKKIKRAVTDSADPPEIRRGEDKPGVTNLIDLLAVCSGRTPDQVVAVDRRRARLRRPQGGGGRGRDRGACADPRALCRAAPRRGRARGDARARCRAGARDRRRDARRRARGDGRRPRRRRLSARPAARLIALIGAIVLVDTLLYAALAPILPALEDEFGLSKAGAGVLVGSYPLGTFLGALPGGWAAARFGPRVVVLTGLATDDGLGGRLRAASRRRPRPRAFCQGLGGAATWTAGLAWLGAVVPRERRGEAIGLAIGAGIFGAQFGPVVGSIADALGRGPTFAAVAALGLVLALLARSEPAPPAPAGAGGSPRLLVRDRPSSPRPG